jgi:hypothetical protein
LYLAGVGTKADPAAAGKAYEKGCLGGDPLGCRELGRIYNFGSPGYTKDQAKAVSNWSKACEGGDKVGCSFLGAAYAEGSGVTKDGNKAVMYRQRACDGGFAPACSGAGEMYEYGQGIPKNAMLAEQMYQRGCFRGFDFASSCAGLGRVLLVKNEKDPMAKSAISRACAFGSAVACAIDKIEFGGNRPAIASPEEQRDATTACGKNEPGGCTTQGLLQALQNPKMAKTTLDRACKFGNDAFACQLVKKIP